MFRARIYFVLITTPITMLCAKYEAMSVTQIGAYNIRFQYFCTSEHNKFYKLIGQIWRIKLFYYLFKKFLVSDWLTANCEIVISTQWLTKYGFFTFILAKWRQRVNMKKIWTRLRHITMTTRIILTRWRHWYDNDDGCRRTKKLFFS
jgi:hypothetical protein